MRTFQIILLIVSFNLVTTQFLRHAYVKWFEPGTSTLEKYSDETEKGISAARTLEELDALYAKAHQQVKEAERTAGDRPRNEFEKKEKEPYKSEQELKQAIQTWESHEKEIHRLHFFWLAGAGCFFLGLGCYAFVNRWIGLATVIVGIGEMIWWTSPSFRVLGAQAEFDRLLTHKLLFTAMTWALVIGAWVLSLLEARRERQRAG